MKKLLITLLVFLLLGGLIFGLLFFFWTAENLASLGTQAMADENYDRAVSWYSQAVEMEPENGEYALYLADAYVASGNFTKAERSLVNALRAAPSAELYCKLSYVYTLQDKLLDAQEMLDKVSNPEIAAQLAALRPAAPTFSYESGEYDKYISIELSSPVGKIYYSLDEEYPSTSNAAYAEPIPLVTGENHLCAIVLSEDGLVSPLATADYLIYGVVEEVSFLSPQLEAYVRDALYLPRTAPITTQDLWAFTELTVSSEVSDYTDLRHFINLTSLTIQDSTVEDYSFLAFTPELVNLDLANSNVTPETLALIGNLSKLETLNLNSCGISNISSLAGNTALVTLDLGENSISDLTPLSAMKALTDLDLNSNAVTSLSGLDKLAALLRLDLAENNIIDLSPLAGCVRLETLNASGNQIAAVDALSALPKLSSLNLTKNKLADLSPLASCSALSRLEAAQNEITVLDFITPLENLNYLDVSYNQIAALPALEDSFPLQQVNLAYNQLEDISSLAGLISLYYVNVDYNENLEDIECLATCYLLAKVDAFGTQVTEVAKLMDMSVVVNYDPSIAIEQDD